MDKVIEQPETGSEEDVPVWKRSNSLLRTEKLLAKMEDGLNIFGVFFIMLLMLLTVGDIVGRYVFNSPILGAVEISELMMAPLVMFGLAYTQRFGGHVRMGLFIEKALKGRKYHITESLILLLCLVVFPVIGIFSLKNALFALKIGETTSTVPLPVWISKMSIPIGAFLFCMRIIIQLFQHLTQAWVGIERRNLS